MKKKNDEKDLILDSTDKYKEVFSRIKSQIETINGGEKICYDKNHETIGVNIDDEMPLNQQIKYPTLTIIIRCVFSK